MFSALARVLGAGATTSTTAARFSITLSATRHNHHLLHCQYAAGWVTGC